MNLVRIYPNSLGETMCNRMISIFEESNLKYEGMTMGGVDKKIKNTIDLHSNLLKDNNEWKCIENIIRKELNTKIEMYYYDINQGDCQNPRYIPYSHIEDSGFQIQRYIANDGFYIYHNDFSIKNNNLFRILTYIWYLNDVSEGGKTYFHDEIIVKPETGKLVIFPALWTYPHKGEVPISNNKYIMTGWIYSKFNSHS